MAVSGSDDSRKGRAPAPLPAGQAAVPVRRQATPTSRLRGGWRDRHSHHNVKQNWQNFVQAKRPGNERRSR